MIAEITSKETKTLKNEINKLRQTAQEIDRSAEATVEELKILKGQIAIIVIIIIAVNQRLGIDKFAAANSKVTSKDSEIHIKSLKDGSSEVSAPVDNVGLVKSPGILFSLSRFAEEVQKIIGFRCHEKLTHSERLCLEEFATNLSRVDHHGALAVGICRAVDKTLSTEDIKLQEKTTANNVLQCSTSKTSSESHESTVTTTCSKDTVSLSIASKDSSGEADVVWDESLIACRDTETDKFAVLDSDYDSNQMSSGKKMLDSSAAAAVENNVRFFSQEEIQALVSNYFAEQQS